MIPILKEDLLSIPNSGVIPAGIASQETMYEEGETVEKKWPTHDASRPRKSNTFVNSLYNKSKLDPAIFAFCIFRILPMIHAMRTQFSNIPILLGKYDLDAAYRRIHARLKEATQRFTIIDRIAFLFKRFPFPFGTAPAADCFNTVSGSITNLAQEQTEDETWDPSTLKSNLSEKITLASLPEKIKDILQPLFHLSIPSVPKSIYHDIYIDDIIVL